MAFSNTFDTIEIPELIPYCEKKQEEGWRFVQLLAVNTEAGIDLVYSFYKDGVLENRVIKGITKDQSVPSITGMFLAAFVFENESHDLFGVNITDIAIDFHGDFYAVSAPEPMTIISPEQLAAREKAAKLAAAKAAKEAKEAQAAQTTEASPQSDLEKLIAEKTAGLEPDKAAKVRAALEAKYAKEQADAKKAEEEALEKKLAAMDPEKAAKVRAAMAAKAAKEKAAELEKLIAEKTAGLDPEKAEKVRAALVAKAEREQAAKDGE